MHPGLQDTGRQCILRSRCRLRRIQRPSRSWNHGQLPGCAGILDERGRRIRAAAGWRCLDSELGATSCGRGASDETLDASTVVGSHFFRLRGSRRARCCGAATVDPPRRAATRWRTCDCLGTVASTRYSPKTKGQPTFLNFDAALPKADFYRRHLGRRSLEIRPAGGYADGPACCATGTIQLYRGTAEIIVSDPRAADNSVIWRTGPALVVGV